MKRNRLGSMIIGLLAIIFTMSTIAATPARDIVLEFDPANFDGHVIDNPYYPLIPGTTFIYRGETEGAPTRDVITVTNDTKEILGVTATVVYHLAYEDGILIEETFDWFAQDKDGNVWYLGEDTKELDENGNVISTEGSWEAGVDGAEAGIIMLADPTKGDRYQQENAPDVAEDMAKVLGFEDSLCVRYGCFEDVLVTKEWSPLEPGVVENKYYARGVGFIFGIMVKGGDEQSELVRIRPRPDSADDAPERDD